MQATPELITYIKEEMQHVINGFVRDSINETDKKISDMCKQDAGYNQCVLDDFLNTRDLQKLEDKIMNQDSAPREEFINVLRKIGSRYA